MDKILAIIPARGGSKRIPKKNIKDFSGKPIIAYSIEAAIKSDIFDEVMVSTDDTDIENISKEYGASVPFKRTAKTADDFSNLADVVNEVIDEYKKRDIIFTKVCLIMATAPFIDAKNLIKANNILTTEDADSVYPLVEFNYPILKSLKIDGQYIKRAFPEHALSRSQDMETFYHDAAQFYFLKLASYNGKSFILDKTLPLIISYKNTHDIDTVEDWEIAEYKYKYFEEHYE